MKRAFAVAAIMVVGVFLASSGWAQYGRRGGGYGLGHATPEQRQQFFEETAELRQSLWQKQDELDAMLSREDGDPAQIGNLQKEIFQLRKQIAQKATDAGIECPYGGPGCGGRGMMGGGYCMRGGMGPGGGMGYRGGMGPGAGAGAPASNQ